MRNFLPIKGPGGRNLTGKEKIALLVLVVTLLLCVLTLVAGERAYLLEGAPNPVFSIVAAFASALGGGIVALYALIMVWSALIYLKGERVADITPLVGRCAAAFAVTIGVSGALGIAQLDAAGGLGDLVGRALGNTFGAGAGFPILILLMLLGAHLASQGAWTALREPMMPAFAAAGGTLAPAGYGFGLAEAPESRLQDGPPLPDDGDPTADERSLAVQQAMEEIERSQGVTIVDMEPATYSEAPAEAEEYEDTESAEAETVGDETRSIGQEVDEAPAPGDETEEAEVQRGLAAVAHALEVTRSAISDVVDEGETEPEEAQDEQAEYQTVRHGLVPVPVGDQATDEEEEEEEEEEDEFAEVEQYDEDEEYETAEEDEDDEADYEEEDVHNPEYADEDEELEDEDEDEDAEGEYDEAEEEEDEDYEGEYAAEEDDDAEEAEAHEPGEREQLELFPEPRDEAETLDDVESEELAREEGADEPDVEAAPPVPEPETVETENDPYAQGGLLRRLQARAPQSESGGDRPHTAFDWRGRPIK